MSLGVFEFAFVVIDAYQDDYLASRKSYGDFHREKFKLWCALLNAQGAIDGTHISILKPEGEYAKDYYYHKTSGLSNCGF
jgi:hypothetical protein